MAQRIRIGTRASRLSQWQANHIAGLLRTAYPGIEIELVTVQTRGDELSDAPLPEIGGAGLFTAALERGLRSGEIDCAAHSLKDLPTAESGDIVLAAAPKRGDSRDALVSRDGAALAQLPKGASIGTGSRRRRAQLLQARADLRMRHIRGNVPTRLEKLFAENSPYAAIVLAVAGLNRLGLERHISQVFEPMQMMPAAGQGALALQCHRDRRDFFAPLNHEASWLAVTAERAFLAHLSAGCSTPIGAYARLQGRKLQLWGRVCALDGARHLDIKLDAALDVGEGAELARQLGIRAAEQALGAGRGGVAVREAVMANLAGRKIVVTRAAHQAGALMDMLRERGAAPVSYPCIAIQPPEDEAAFERQLRDLHAFDVLALTSANAVSAVAGRLHALNIKPVWKRIRVVAVGLATSAAMREAWGIEADYVPAEQTGESLARGLPQVEGRRILLPQSALSSDAPAAILRSRGADVTAVVAYDTVMGSGGGDVPGMLARGELDALTFVSPSAVSYFVRRCRAAAALRLPAICLGEVTARRARELGFAQVITPEATGMDAMVDALTRFFAQ